jgi:hypothetical protein
MADRRSVQEKVDAIRADLAAMRVELEADIAKARAGLDELIKDSAEPVIKDEPTDDELAAEIDAAEVEAEAERELSTDARPTEVTGCACGRQDEHGPHEYGEPSTDDACQDCDQQYPSKCEVCAEPSTDDRSWKSLKLITTRTGQCFVRKPEGWWESVGGERFRRVDDDVIAEMAPIRECVIVTLPTSYNGYANIGRWLQSGGHSPNQLREWAAELLAAARAAERAGGAGDE